MAADLTREKMRAAGASVLAGAVLTVLKLAAGLVTGSIGLLAEAVHSALDLAAAVLTWVAVRTSWRPPDADHHYGHGKIENLAALAETLLLFIAALWILYEAIARIMGEGPEVEPTAWAFVVMFLSMIVDYYRSRDLKRVADESGSQALEADALHFSTDVASSAVVILGLIGVVVARRFDVGWMALADPVAAIMVSVVVLFLSWKLGRKAVDILLDKAPTALAPRIEKILADLDAIQELPRIRVRQAGDRVFADIELRLRPGIPLIEGDRIASVARTRVKEITGPGSSVLVQLLAERNEMASLRERIAMAVTMEGQQAHNITLRQTGLGTHADLHLELPGRLTLAEGHAITDRVEQRILREVDELGRVDIHLELHRGEEPEKALDVDVESQSRLATRIQAISKTLVGEGAVHDLMISRTPAGYYLSCHCFLPPGTSLVDAHELTDRLERELRRAIPELARVAVHAEPEGTP
jgi:cation diffusion facilitator family transporter